MGRREAETMPGPTPSGGERRKGSKGSSWRCVCVAWVGSASTLIGGRMRAEELSRSPTCGGGTDVPTASASRIGVMFAAQKGTDRETEKVRDPDE